MSSELDDKVHRIAGDLVGGLRKDVDAKFAEVRASSVVTNATLANQDKVLSQITTKIDAIYGNGSGKKGILEDIKEDQKELKEDLKTSQQEVKKAFEDSENKAAEFRHEVRNAFETLKLQQVAQQTEKTVTTQIETRYGGKAKVEREWIKWVVGGLAFVLWEFIKHKMEW